MSMQTGESGKLFGYNTNFDLTTNTELSLEFTTPAGVLIVIDPPRLSVGGVDKIFNEGGVDVLYLAGQYIQFIVVETDFTVAGSWFVCGTYTNGSTSPSQVFKGEIRGFPVGFGC